MSESSAKSRNIPCGLAQPNQFSAIIIILPAELGGSDLLVISVMGGKGAIWRLIAGTLYQIQSDIIYNVTR